MNNMEDALKGKGQLRIEKSKLVFPHLGAMLTYIAPLINPEKYDYSITEEIDSYRPTAAQVISLLDLALQNPGDPHCRDILKNSRRGNYLITSTENLSFLKGVFVYDNPDGKMPHTSEELIRLLEGGDRRVKFVNPDFKTGTMSIHQFLCNPITIAQIGQEMLGAAERVAGALYEGKNYYASASYIFCPDRNALDKRSFTTINTGINVNRLNFEVKEHSYANQTGYIARIEKK